MLAPSRAAPWLIAVVACSITCGDDGGGSADAGSAATLDGGADTGVSTTAADGTSGGDTGDGGVDAGGTQCTAGDLIDVWRDKAQLGTARQDVGVTVLDDEIWVIGGQGVEDGLGLTLVEIYDPARDVWRPGPDVPLGMVAANAVTAGGTIWILGYLRGDSAEPTVYELDTGAWVESGSLADGRARGGSGLTVIGDVVHVVGGSRSGDPVDEHDVFDPMTGMFTQRAGLPSKRAGVALGAAGSLLVAMGGKESKTGAAQPRVDVYDPATDSWSAGPEMPVGRIGAVAFVLEDQLHVCGGQSAGGSLSTRCDRFDAQAQCWQEVTGMPRGRRATHAAVVGDTAFVPAGADGSDLAPTGAVLEFDPW